VASAATWLAGPALLAGLVLAWVATWRRKGGAGAAAVSVVTWHVMAWGLLAGLFRPPRATAFQVLDAGEGGP
jgi:hypothetical protein